MTGERSNQDRLDLLRGVPLRIAAATNGVADATLHQRTAEEPWSVNDVLAHIRAAAENRMRFMRRMATGEHEELPYVSPRSELQRTDYVDRPFAENLAAFTADRATFLGWLETLPAEAWNREVSIRDRPESIATYARYLCEHELAHCEQIEALVG